MDHRQAGIAEALDEAFDIGHDPGDAADIVAEACTEAAGLGEIALHVDDDEGELIVLHRKREGFCLDPHHQ